MESYSQNSNKVDFQHEARILNGIWLITALGLVATAGLAWGAKYLEITATKYDSPQMYVAIGLLLLSMYGLSKDINKINTAIAGVIYLFLISLVAIVVASLAPVSAIIVVFSTAGSMFLISMLAGLLYSQDIVDTTWGPIFTACYPVTAEDESNEVIGAFCIEMDMQKAYGMVEKTNKLSIVLGCITACILVILCTCGYSVYKKQKENEQKQQKLLQEAARLADSANKAKSTFLFNMSHDIRTPMECNHWICRIGSRNI